MNIHYHFSVLVLLIVLERSHWDCYTPLVGDTVRNPTLQVMKLKF